MVQACLRAPPVVADEVKLAIVFTYFFSSFFLFFFFYAFCFPPTSVKLPSVKICFPQYFGITRRYMQKKNRSNFYFFTEKTDFRAFFLHGQHSVAELGPTPSPWSIYHAKSMVFHIEGNVESFCTLSEKLNLWPTIYEKTVRF